ncbi:MAG: hypothetical protein ACI9GW_002644 [Halieaceae bacterium]
MNIDIQASLRYLIPGAEKPVYTASTGGEHAQLNISAKFEDREVTIRDARGLAAEPTLDVEGFSLVRQETQVADFYQFDFWRDSYEAELIDTLLQHTAATRVLIFDHTLRSSSPTMRGQHSLREPASVVHNDYTDYSAVKRLRELVSSAQSIDGQQDRFAIVNLWRTINYPIGTSPLTCCDASTILTSDLVASERRSEDRVGELQLVSWNPNHRWYWFPKMHKDEVLLFKTFDSCVGVARRSIHSAFENPSAPDDAPPRESIESRALLFF